MKIVLISLCYAFIVGIVCTSSDEHLSTNHTGVTSSIVHGGYTKQRIVRTLTNSDITRVSHEYDHIFQKCFDIGEVYSASMLMTSEYAMRKNTEFNMSRVNLELDTMMFMRNNWRSYVQSVDLLDFSVLH